MHAFILAGGFATRLWPLTERRSKPLLPINGKPLITHLVDGLPSDLPVTVSTNDAFSGAFRGWAATLGRPVEILVEATRADDHKLGALGAVASWVQEAQMQDDVLLLTGDNYLGFRMADFLAAFRGHPLVAAHDIGDLGRASAFGTIVLDKADSRRVEAFEEKPKEPRTTLVSAGCAVIPRSALPALVAHAAVKPDNMGGIFEELVRAGTRVECFPFTEPWIDIGSFQSYLDAHRMLVGGGTLKGPATTDAGCTYEGSVSIGKDCRLTRCHLKDCMVFDGCELTDCTLRDCVIDDGCVLKGADLQRQMLRAGTRIELP